MKKGIFSLCIFLLAVAATSAQSLEKAVFYQNLVKYNQSTVQAGSSQRSWWQSILHVCAVAGADIGGAYAGVQAASGAMAVVGLATGGTGAVAVGVVSGVICGAGASYGAHVSLSGNRSIPVVTAPRYGNLSVIVPEKYKDYAHMGITHNDVLYNNFYQKADIGEFYRKSLDAQQVKAMESSVEVRNRSIIQSLGQKYGENNFDFPAMSSGLVANQLMSGNGKQVLDLFMQKYATCGSPQDIQNIVNYYIDQVSKSDKDLQENERSGLIAGFIVASESPFFLLEK